eukprot:s2555_g5.t1
MSTLWTINAGGWPGLWRLIDVLKGMKFADRPAVTCVQEVSCGLEDWLGVQGSFAEVGVQVFASSNLHTGNRKKGIVFLVKQGVGASQVAELEDWCGTCLAISIDRTMVLGSYCPPRATCIAEHMSNLDGFLVGINWRGDQIWCGDWNEVFEGSLVSSLASHHHLRLAEFEVEVGTRWQSLRQIDFFLHNFQYDIRAKMLEHNISDHKIVQIDVPLTHVGHDDVCFKKESCFRRPSWLTTSRWNELFETTFKEGVKRGWQEVCADLESSQDEISQHDPDEDLDQKLIDYMWRLAMTKLLWSFKMAAYLALLELPDELPCQEEVQRITHLANHTLRTRNEVRLQKRSFEVSGRKRGVHLQQLRNQLGRALELRLHWEKGKWDKSTEGFIRKIFPDRKDANFCNLNNKIDGLMAEVKKLEHGSFRLAIDKWKKAMRSCPASRSRWINRSNMGHLPAVEGPVHPSRTKQEACESLLDFWKRLHQRVEWGHDERSLAVAEFKIFLQDFFELNMDNAVRPGYKIFCKAIKRMHGTSGLDQWTHQELKTVANCSEAISMVWRCMQMWDELGLSPTILKHSKICFVPKIGKKHNNVTSPGKLRPICVFSTWWRAWSSTWMRSHALLRLESVLPRSIKAKPGTSGAEVAAAVFDYKANAMGFGASLDYSHCFDCVGLGLLHGAIGDSLPFGLRPWFELLMEHWKGNNRWILYGGHPFSTPYLAQIGISQGDAASPLMLNLLMAFGEHWVLSRRHGIGSVEHCIYMDDRSFVAENKDDLEELIDLWGLFACKFHLIENQEKTQRFSTLKQDDDPRYMQQIEVLGAVVGAPSFDYTKNHEKSLKRVFAASSTARRISGLPISQNLKSTTLASFAGGKLTYGWISSKPTCQQATSYSNMLWKSLGHLHYAVPQLKRLLIGAHLDAEPCVLSRQLFVLAKRNAELFGNESHLQNMWVALDYMVHEGLQDLGWFCHGYTWFHEELEGSFKFYDVVEKKKWPTVLHLFRESFRWSMWQSLQQSSRHEFKDKQLPPFN